MAETKKEVKSSTQQAKDVRELARGINGRMRNRAIELAENIITIENKLKIMRVQFDKEPAITTYSNGASQSGTRANPFFDQYIRVLSKYESLIKSFFDLMERADVNDIQKDSISEMRNSVANRFKAYKVS